MPYKNSSALDHLFASNRQWAEGMVAKDPEFFKFYASLNAYKTSLTKENTQFVLSPDSEFFKYLKLGK